MFHRWEIENVDAVFGQVQSPELVAKCWVTRYLQHLTWFELCDLVPPTRRNGYLSFSWVRNPWDRLVSIYSRKDPDMLQQARQGGLRLEQLSFEDFVTATMNLRHVHLQPQYTFILDRDRRPVVDFIGRFENFQSDFRELCRRLGVDVELPHRNRSVRADYRSYYTDRSRELVAARYRTDIEAFNYSF
jgi:hypothetical protein